MIKHLAPKSKLLSISFHDEMFSRYKGVETRRNRKTTEILEYTEWPQSDFEVLSIKGTSYK